MLSILQVPKNLKHLTHLKDAFISNWMHFHSSLYVTVAKARHICLMKSQMYSHPNADSNTNSVYCTLVLLWWHPCSSVRRPCAWWRRSWGNAGMPTERRVSPHCVWRNLCHSSANKRASRYKETAFIVHVLPSTPSTDLRWRVTSGDVTSWGDLKGLFGVGRNWEFYPPFRTTLRNL